MTTKIIKDYRRFDDNRTLWTPYWLVSSEIKGADISDATMGLLWSFPAAKYGTSRILLMNFAIQITTLFSGGTPSLQVGSYTLATDDVTTGGVATDVDPDEYIPTADITEGTVGTYWAATGDWITAALLMTNGAPTVITPADTTVPCIGIIGNSSLAAGVARVLVQVSEIPFK